MLIYAGMVRGNLVEPIAGAGLNPVIGQEMLSIDPRGKVTPVYRHVSALQYRVPRGASLV